MIPSSILQQPRLPLRVALEVALQGIRNRLGRSVVTLLGTALGIAFLMAMLTGQVIRRGVSRETELRAEVDRRISFLLAKTGPLKGAAVGVIAAGPLEEVEERLLRRLVREEAAHLQWSGHRSERVEREAAGAVAEREVAKLAEGAAAVLVCGGGPLPAADWVGLAQQARQGVLALLRDYPDAIGGAPVRLARVWHADEQARREAQARRERTRQVWIAVLALLVTVIGISNAMLMSVTERFREIGTMKCLGALSGFVRRLFLIEASLLGLAGSLGGVLGGCLFAAGAYAITYGPELVLAALDPGRLLVNAALGVAGGVALSVVAALYPAAFAARMVPAAALRSTV